MLRCPHCGNFFKNKDELKKHDAEVHGKKIPHIGRTRNIV